MEIWLGPLLRGKLRRVVGRCGLGVLVAAPLAADVRLAPVFSDRAVLQRDRPIVVWGAADAGEAVKVEFQGNVAETRAGAQGEWSVALPATGSATTGSDLIVTGKNRATCRDVQIGRAHV